MSTELPPDTGTGTGNGAGTSADATAARADSGHSGEPGTEARWHQASKIRLLRAPLLLGLLPPAVVIFFLAGARPGNTGFVAMLITVACWPVVVATLFGLDWIHWRAARHRVTDTHFELRSGVVWRRYRSIPRDRVRSVDVSAHPLYRILGLAVVRVGTGESVGASADSEFKLEGVTRRRADELRQQLLWRAPASSYDSARDPEATTVAGVAGDGFTDVPIARMRPSWLRFAPLTLSVVLITPGGLIGIGSEIVGGRWDMVGQYLTSAVDVLGSIWLVAVASVVALLLTGFIGSFVLFLEAWSNFLLVREPGGTLRVTRGLLTIRSVSLEESRLRGAEVAQPLLVRWARGARVNAIATGLSSKQEANKAADRKALLPPAPRAEAYRVADAVTGESVLEKLDLTGHPRAALRRRLTWALTPVLLVVAALAVFGYVFAWMPDWVWPFGLLLLPVAAAAAVDAFRALGHGLSDQHLVTRYGTGIRRTIALRREGIIGWNVTQSPLQRRSGIATLAATTAAGDGAYKVRDTTTTEALSFARDAVPDLLKPFLEKES